MKKRIGVAAVLLLVAVALWLFSRPQNQSPEKVSSTPQNPIPASNPISPRKTSTTLAPAVSPNPISTTATAPVSPAPLAANAGVLVQPSSPVTNLPPEIILQNVRRAVRQYGEMFGGNPVGTNPEITSQLNGDNPKHISFIDPSAGMNINAAGELVDSWNTPLFFHQNSATDMEIHSAGPDKTMWTRDDLTYK